MLKPCCDGPPDVPAANSAVVALVGAPNVGKSTLFNALTGAGVTMGNWPGTTVEVARGIWRQHDREVTLVDLPGAYSLEPTSPDEALTGDLLASATPPDLVLAVVDAAHLSRSLALVAELRERRIRLVVVVTMADVGQSHGVVVDTYALAEAIGVPVVAVDPRRRRGIDNLSRIVREALGDPPPRHRAIAPREGDDLALADERFGWVADVVTRGTTDNGESRTRWSDRIDAIATAPVLGPLAFLAVMWLVFQVTTTVAAPLQEALDDVVTGPVSDAATWTLDLVGLQDAWVSGLVVDGLVAGVGMVLTFTPLMALMFILLAVLEDSGYMARAAVVTDRLMGRLGLPGRAFLPLVVGFGCNVPAIAATRVLGSPQQRILTSLLVPFTSCTARLTVYVMLGTVFFGEWAGTAVFLMYLTSIALVIGVGFLLRTTLWRTMGAEPLILDLPPYQVPTVRLTLAVAWVRLRGFLQTASGIIVVTVVAVWLVQQIPVGFGAFGEVAVGDSLYGALAKAVTPLFAPTGFAQWETVSALLVGFVAKEAVLSSWAQTYSAVDDAALSDQLRLAFETSSSGHPLAAVAAFFVFLLAYTPCVATLAAQWRELGAKWTAVGFAMQLVVAYTLAVAVFQIGRVLW
jgi:ferrous iron transport protein B